MRLFGSLLLLAWKQLSRHRLRSLFTLCGVGAGIFLFTAVETAQRSLEKATATRASDNVLVVYRENRFCPMTSRLPEYYQAEIERIPGVAEAIPIKITVNNCGASLDVITFRGVPPEDLRLFNPDLRIVDGSFAAWKDRGDAALIGRHFAAHRGLKPGDTFEAVGVRVVVAGILESPHPQDSNVAYVHLPFLQQASRAGLGEVTQYNVRVDDPSQMETIAQAIDERFATDSAPTHTRPEKAFFAQTASDMIEMIGFTRWLGLGAVLGVLGLVANALLLIARTRVKESAILQTLGFSGPNLALLTILEGVILGAAGGLLGSLAATLFFHFRRFTFGNEGLTLALSPSLSATIAGVGIALVLGLLASMWPALISARRPIVTSLRGT